MVDVEQFPGCSRRHTQYTCGTHVELNWLIRGVDEAPFEVFSRSRAAYLAADCCHEPVCPSFRAHSLAVVPAAF